MTPEQLEEIPGIGEKTLEKISVAVRHYFGHLKRAKKATCPETAEGEAIDAEHAEAEAAETTEGVSVRRPLKRNPAKRRIENAPAVVDERKPKPRTPPSNLEEAESVQAAEGGSL
jgi:N utilization substance protein A